MPFFLLFSTEFPSTGKGEPIVSGATQNMKEKAKASHAVKRSPYLRNSTVPMSLRHNSPAPYLAGGEATAVLS